MSERTETVGAARARYFEVNGFGAEGNYEKPWVPIQLGIFTFTIPNTASRARIIQYHDIHHVLTGYGTDVRGEAEIGAWSIGAGPPSATSWWINLMAMGFGLVACPIRTWRAYARGLHATPTYGRPVAPLLARDLAAIRAELGMDCAEVPVDAPAALYFAAASTVALATLAFMLAASPILMSVRWVHERRLAAAGVEI